MTGKTALIAVTHLLGVGHLVRAAAIARALVDRGWRVVIASGGRTAPNVETRGCEFIQLPALHCLGVDFRRLRRPDGEVADADYLAERRRMLLEAFDACRPDVVITELYPFGRRQLAQEFDALIARAHAATPRPAMLCSIRDVLQTPWRADRTDAVLALFDRFYDALLFHGDDALIPLSASWPVGPGLQRRLRVTGYVRDASRAAGRAGESEDGADEIIVSSGGSDAGLALSRAALDAARLRPASTWRLLVGHGVGEGLFREFCARAPAGMIVERARADFPALLTRAAISVSQAGYNTILDLAAAQARAILVPFAHGGETEQTVRAQRLADRGLARVIPENELSGPRLLEEIAEIASAERPDWSAVALDGAARAAAVIAEEEAAAAERGLAWRALHGVLAELRQAGRMAPVWLRDDDMTEMTDKSRAYLDRFAQWKIPVALAVVPARAAEDLGEALAGYDGVDVLVHGWAHANHAPAGVKSCEFAAGRPLAAMIAELDNGLRRLAAIMPARALPILAPPWNRIVEEMIPELPALGYRGLSMFRDRRAVAADDFFPRRDSHWNPIAARAAGGGLGNEAALIRALRDLIAQELTVPPGALEPIGLLTHHLVHDDRIDRFLREVFTTLIELRAVRFIGARQAFGLEQPT